MTVLSSELWDMRVFMIYFNLVPRVSRSRGREEETAWKRNWLFPLSHVTGMESRFYSPLQQRISRNTLCLYPRPLPPKTKCCVSMVFSLLGRLHVVYLNWNLRETFSTIFRCRHDTLGIYLPLSIFWTYFPFTHASTCYLCFILSFDISYLFFTCEVS